MTMYEVWGTFAPVRKDALLSQDPRGQRIGRHETEGEAMQEAEYQIESLRLLTRLQVIAPDGSVVFDTV